MPLYKIVVIGAGPAGMLAALRAAAFSDGVVLLEKGGYLGSKLRLTGKGRCNMTNEKPLADFLECFGKDGPFLRDAFRSFFVSDLLTFFRQKGLALKVERQDRVFPETDSALSVIDVLKKDLKKSGVKVLFHTAVKDLWVEDGVLKGVSLFDGKLLKAARVIVATGGASFPQTGSTGDGFRMAHQIGHSVTPLYPGLVPLEVKERFVKDLQGLVLRNIRITFSSGSQRLRSPVGELLFTHFGISGPLILDMSGRLCAWLKTSGPLLASLDLKPGLSAEKLQAKLVKELQQGRNMHLRTYLKTLLPLRMVDVFIKAADLVGEKRSSQVTSVERNRITALLKNFPLTIKRPRPLSEAMVTHGGVSLREINPKTMASKKIKGLSFCGEVIDLAAKSGGYNLQAAFSTGYVAGEAAARSLES